MTDQRPLYRSVFQHINTETELQEPYGLIQWKGTNVCIDLHCVCGAHMHADDEEFFYFVRCGKCKAAYAVGAYVKLVPLRPEDVSEVDGRFHELEDLDR